MIKEVENPMVVDDCWPDYEDEEEEQESEWERFCRMADEEHDEDAAYIAEHGWGRANGYTL